MLLNFVKHVCYVYAYPLKEGRADFIIPIFRERKLKFRHTNDCIIALIRHWFFIYCSLVLYNCTFKFLLTFMINNGRIYFIFLKHGYLILFNPNWYKGSEFVLYSQTLQETVILQTKFFLIIKFWATINIRNLNNVNRLKNLT